MVYNTYTTSTNLYMQTSTMPNSSMTTTSKNVKWSAWATQANRYMQPRVNDRGLKTVAVISTQKNKKLHVQLPSLTCWGITDYTDLATGESDGKYSAKLHFSGKENASDDSKVALEKLRSFEEQILKDAVTNSEAWFGKKLSRELVEDRYFPFLKPGKNAETKQPDPEKGVYFRPKVNCYSGKWDIEVFDPEGTPLFPSENDAESPMDFVPSGSSVTCGIECKQIWLGAKGWGISWALKQTVVIPKLSENTTGKLQLDMSDADKASMYNAPPPAPEEVVEATVVESEEKTEVNTHVEDSDDEVPQEAEAVVEEEPEPEPEPEPVVEEVKPAKKTVVKKAVATPPPAAAADEPAPASTKKKVVRKKV